MLVNARVLLERYMFNLKKGLSLVLKGILACFLMIGLVAGVAGAATETKDIRVLIDISGSMKKNDPNNLRIPAINLLTELVPEGSKAGVWTFGQYVNMLVKHDVVDKNWRKMAKLEAKKVNSVALYTNIGGVLNKSSDDFPKSDDFKNTHFILLTDGMVDIDRDPEKNIEERQRILSEIAKKFKAKGAIIHTIALSKNADTSFLEQLAVATGGTTEVAETSEDLTRIFSRTFDQAVPAEQVPLEGNRFDIDSSVEELTALIFRKPGSRKTQLQSPENKIYSADNKPDYVNWYADTGYDLITVKHPYEGTWTVDADVLPDSRVTVVSNLQLMVDKLPINFFAGDVLNVVASFEEDGKKITSPDFLKLLDVDLVITREDGKSGTKRLSEGAPPADGIFLDKVSKLSMVGQYEVSIMVDGKTFKRKNRQIINLRSPLNVELNVAPPPSDQEGQDQDYLLSITPLSDDIDLVNTRIAARITAPDGTNEIKNVELTDGKAWSLPVLPTKGDGTYRIDLKVKGVKKDGGSFQFAPRSFDAVFPVDPAAGKYQNIPEPLRETNGEDLPAPNPPPEPVVEIPPEPVVEPEVQDVVAPPIEVPPQLEQEVTPPAEDKSMLYIAAGIGATAFLLLAGLGGWLLMRKKKEKAAQEDELMGLGDLDVDDTPISSPKEPAPVLDEPMPAVRIEEELEIDDELDFVEEGEDPIPQLDEPEPEPEPEPEAEPETTAEELDAILGDLIDPDEKPLDEPSFDESIEETLAAAAEEPDDSLDEPVEEEPDIPVVEPEEEPEEDEEEFNLEDFDISDTDDLPDDGKR